VFCTPVWMIEKENRLRCQNVLREEGSAMNVHAVFVNMSGMVRGHGGI
jgi:hypothetical protein